MKGKRRAKLESIRTKARWSLPHLVQERNNRSWKSKTGFRNSTQNGSIKSQRHSPSHTNFDTEKKTTMKMDSKLEPKLKRDRRYHTNFELKTIKQNPRTFWYRFNQTASDTVASKSYNRRKTINNGNKNNPKTDVETRTRFDRSNESDIVAPTLTLRRTKS